VIDAGAHGTPSPKCCAAIAITAAVTSIAGNVTAVCDVMGGRGWCHKCVSLGCHGPAHGQTPRTLRMSVPSTAAVPPPPSVGGWASTMELMPAMWGVSSACMPTRAH
jgi:hypothetical protein